MPNRDQAQTGASAGETPALELRQLHSFAAVVAAGQITAAAGRLNVAQPALSRTIARLEATAGTPLLVRGRRGVTLTPAGRAFHAHALRSLNAAEAAMAAVAARGPAGHVLRLGYGSHTLPPLAQPALRELTRRRPDVEVRLEQVPPRRRGLELLAGEIDVEVVVAPVSGAGLEAVALRRCERLVVMRDSHPLAGREHLRIEDIEDETFPGVHPEISPAWRDTWLLSDQRRTPPRLTPDTPQSLEEAWGLIISGRAITIVPDFMAPEIARDGIVAVPLTGVPPVEVVLVRGREQNELVEELFEVVRAAGPDTGGPAPPDVGA